MRYHSSNETVQWMADDGRFREVVLSGSGANEAANLLEGILGCCKKEVVIRDDSERPTATWCHRPRSHKGKCKDHDGNTPTDYIAQNKQGAQP